METASTTLPHPPLASWQLDTPNKALPHRRPRDKDPGGRRWGQGSHACRQRKFTLTTDVLCNTEEDPQRELRKERIPSPSSLGCLSWHSWSRYWYRLWRVFIDRKLQDQRPARQGRSLTLGNGWGLEFVSQGAVCLSPVSLVPGVVVSWLWRLSAAEFSQTPGWFHTEVDCHRTGARCSNTATLCSSLCIQKYHHWEIAVFVEMVPPDANSW